MPTQNCMRRRRDAAFFLPSALCVSFDGLPEHLYGKPEHADQEFGERQATMNYNALAACIGTYPSLSIFRRFLILHARDLLCMQGELIQLDHKLRMTIEGDREAQDAVRNALEYDISAMKGPHESEIAGVQWRLTQELRGLLKNYGRSSSPMPCDAQLRFAALCQLAPVNKSDLSAIHELLENPAGKGPWFLRTHEIKTWDEENIKDLALLDGRHKNQDAFSRLIARFIGRVYHPLVGHKLHDPLSDVEAWGRQGKPPPLIHYPDTHITTAINTLSTILASVLPAFCAFGLFFIRDPLVRMGATVACTVLFSAVLTLVAKPSRAQCFAITSTFAAVLIVFSGSPGGSAA